MEFNESKLAKSVEIIKDLVNNKSEDKKQSLLKDSSSIFVQIVFKKIPNVKENRHIKIPLPHRLIEDNAEVCLITKDLDKTSREYEDTEENFRELLKEKNISEEISAIVPLKQIKLEHQTYEAKRHLSTLYDIFLADSRVYRLLPAILGKAFYDRHKFPISFDLEAKNLKKELQRALSFTFCELHGKGQNVSIPVGSTEMKNIHVAQNINAILKVMSKETPGGSNNFRMVNLISSNCPSLPLHVDYGNKADVILSETTNEKKVEEDLEEIDTQLDKKVKVGTYGDIDVYDMETGMILSTTKKLKKNLMKKKGLKRLNKKNRPLLEKKDKETGKEKNVKKGVNKTKKKKLDKSNAENVKTNNGLNDQVKKKTLKKTMKDVKKITKEKNMKKKEISKVTKAKVEKKKLKSKNNK
ncbi:unnamed protein product [Dimorphilus gyrociliatus]|uniref:Ribosomal L1 domain-containing protein 1 n=1 Tax=Dimorphilus gyrociliatus TaxID=2664684 RepID=A0A7I8W591_9ANNE|nr:unnamed protein product [Dimorphilus gyrociliatus]